MEFCVQWLLLQFKMWGLGDEKWLDNLGKVCATGIALNQRRSVMLI